MLLDAYNDNLVNRLNDTQPSYRQTSSEILTRIHGFLFIHGLAQPFCEFYFPHNKTLKFHIREQSL